VLEDGIAGRCASAFSSDLSAAAADSVLGGDCCGAGKGAGAGAGAGTVVSAGVDGRVFGLTASTGLCWGVLAGVGVAVTLSTSSSTLGCREAACCAALTRDCEDGLVVDLADLEVETGLDVDIVGDTGVEVGVEAGISSRVTFCWENREEVEED
jgi:hypothetical protein